MVAELVEQFGGRPLRGRRFGRTNNGSWNCDPEYPLESLDVAQVARWGVMRFYGSARCPVVVELGGERFWLQQCDQEAAAAKVLVKIRKKAGRLGMPADRNASVRWFA